MVGGFGVVYLACDLGIGACAHIARGAKRGPARLAGKGGAKYLGCGKGEGSPNPPPTQSGARRHRSGNPRNKFPLYLFGNGVRSCLKTAAIALSLAHIFILISFQVLAPLRRGSLFVPGSRGALARRGLWPEATAAR